MKRLKHSIEAGVSKIVYTSLVNAQDEDNPSIEKLIMLIPKITLATKM